MLSLAIRNLLRNRRRSLGTVLAVAIGAMSVLLFGGYRLDIKYNMQTNHVRAGGHLQIQHRDFYTFGAGNPTAYGIQDYEALIRAIESDGALSKMLSVVTASLQFGAIAGNYAAGVSRTVIALGVRASDVDRMRGWDPYGVVLQPPRIALLGAPPDSSIVGNGLARVLRVCAGLGLSDCARSAGPEALTPQGPDIPKDLAALSQIEGQGPQAPGAGAKPRIEVLASTPTGTPNVAQLQVVASENQGIKEFDDVFVMMNLAQAQRLVYGRSQSRATAVVVQLHRTEQISEAKARLESIIAGLGSPQPLVAMDFEQLNPYYVQAVRLFDTIFGFIFVLIGGIVLFTVDNTMNTAVIERTVEIGTLRAMGLRRKGIEALFVLEGLVLGAAGAILGVAAAAAISAAVNHSGIMWQAPGYAVAVPLSVRVWGEWTMMFGTAIGLIAVTAASAWMPARRAARLNIVDALRHT